MTGISPNTPAASHPLASNAGKVESSFPKPAESTTHFLARRFVPLAVLLPCGIGAGVWLGYAAGLYSEGVAFALLVCAMAAMSGGAMFLVAWVLDRRERDAQALYRSLVDTVPINIIRKDLQGRVTFCNRHYCASMGRCHDDLLGKTDFDLFPPELAAKYVKDDQDVIRTCSVFEDIEEHCNPGGERKYMHVLKAPVLDADDVVLGTQVVFWDVTARKQAEQALERMASDLKRSNRDLEQFAYVASHDLQEPLRMVASFTQLLAKRYGEKLDAEGREFISFAVDGAVRMQKLINDLLAYSRVGTRGEPFEAVNTLKTLDAVRDNLMLKIEETGATITCGSMPVVQADPMQLIQLFQNLISNALKFRGSRAPQIHITAVSSLVPSQSGPACEGKALPPQKEWLFCFEDNGIGIESKYFERIFGIFVRLHTREEYPGTGIGLALCKKIVERHGGHIWIESVPDQGSKFLFTLPGVPEKVVPQEFAR